MLVTILYRMEGSPQGAGWGPFTDVTPGAYYAQPIAWAAWNWHCQRHHIDHLRPGSERHPGADGRHPLPLYRLEGVGRVPAGEPLPVYGLAEGADLCPHPLGLGGGIRPHPGKENQRLDPGGPATRAEVATILQRFHSTYVAPPAEEETA